MSARSAILKMTYFNVGQGSYGFVRLSSPYRSGLGISISTKGAKLVILQNLEQVKC